jgi:hypothetical protein
MQADSICLHFVENRKISFVMKTIAAGILMFVFMLTGVYSQEPAGLPENGNDLLSTGEGSITDTPDNAGNYKDQFKAELADFILKTLSEFCTCLSIDSIREPGHLTDSSVYSQGEKIFWLLQADHNRYSAKDSFNLLEVIKKEYDKMVKENCERSIAGLFVAISLFNNSNIILSGKIIKEAFDRYNPAFRQYAPKCFESLCRIRILRNDRGIITLTTTDGKPIIIDKLKINDDSRMKFTVLGNGDVRIDFLEGVKVGKAIIWFPLNYIRLSKTTGNIVFDYDDNHTQITMNLKKDLMF